MISSGVIFCHHFERDRDEPFEKWRRDRDYSRHPAFRPSGRRRYAPPYKIAPDNFVEPRHGFEYLFTVFHKIGHKAQFFEKWRRDRDSNPGRAINPCRFSRPVHSTALPSLRNQILQPLQPLQLSLNLLEYTGYRCTIPRVLRSTCGRRRYALPIKFVPDEFVNALPSLRNPGMRLSRGVEY